MKKNQILPLLLCLLLLAAALTGCGPEEPPQWTPVGGTAQTETQLPERAAPTAQPETEVTAVQEAYVQEIFTRPDLREHRMRVICWQFYNEDQNPAVPIYLNGEDLEKIDAKFRAEAAVLRDMRPEPLGW